ncbi:MAG TPA: serine/threonine-protein kinase, partial [Polyangiales bacterium]|nr:serine/threonine-protein kinase [Polyangiales bacterium]
MFFFAIGFLSMSPFFIYLGNEMFSDSGRESHVLACIIAFAIWRIALRSRPLSRRALYALDGIGTFLLCLCLVLMAYRMGRTHVWGFFAGTLGVFHVTTARAIMVPSTPRRTLIISLASFLGLVVSGQISIPAGFDGEHARAIALLAPLTWSVSGTALATLTSHVIYGLRRAVVRAQQLGQYTLERKIGAGGMGEVYRAHHALLRRPTAIKLLAGDVSDAQARRFEQEVQLTASLTHPNTISIYDFGRTPDGTFYYVMELLEGSTLYDVVQRSGAQAPARVVHILLQACAALREAHGAGLIHRDIKPENIFLCRLGGQCDVVKVLDFGLVKQITPNTDVMLSNYDTLVG